MEEKDFSESISFPDETANKNMIQNVNENYEQLVQDVRKMIQENNEAAILE